MSWQLDAEGWLQGDDAACTRIESPNQEARPPGMPIDLVVLHNISLPPGEFGGPGVVDLFTNQLDWDAHPYYQQIRDMRVSAHFFVRRDGSLIQFVACGRRAWHAGVSEWQGRDRCNDFSIGIELEGSDSTPFTEPQYATLDRLLPLLRKTYPVSAVVGHSDVAPGRKTDPGPCFDWTRIAPR